jgi:hypothetical protein
LKSNGKFPHHLGWETLSAAPRIKIFSHFGRGRCEINDHFTVYAVRENTNILVPITAVILRTAMQEGQAEVPDSGAGNAGEN